MAEADNIEKIVADLTAWVRGKRHGSAPLCRQTAMRLLAHIELLEDRITTTEDALQGLMDWTDEGCPDGGRFALVEAKAALRWRPRESPALVPNGRSEEGKS